MFTHATNNGLYGLYGIRLFPYRRLSPQSLFIAKVTVGAYCNMPLRKTTIKGVPVEFVRIFSECVLLRRKPHLCERSTNRQNCVGYELTMRCMNAPYVILHFQYRYLNVCRDFRGLPLELLRGSRCRERWRKEISLTIATLQIPQIILLLEFLNTLSNNV